MDAPAIPIETTSEPFSGPLEIGRSIPRQTLLASFLWSAVATVCFHSAYSFPALSFLIFGYTYCLLQLVRARSNRVAFYCGLAVGLLIAGPQLAFFWTIFGLAAVALWLVLAFWIALFTGLARILVTRFGSIGCVLLPVLWTGLEYFRSELYPLKFSWLNIGYALAGTPTTFLFQTLGMYGIGFFAMLGAVLCSNFVSMHVRLRILKSILLLFGLWLFLALTVWISFPAKAKAPGHLNVMGIQVEFPATFEVIADLNRALQEHPETDLFMLSEYTFDGPIPPEVTTWCREHGKFLIAGGKDLSPGTNFYNTAFVVGTNGDIVFKQVKSVPIQFFKDGLPAPEQKLWDSPWGKLGICICYDLSYTRVTDRLIAMGAKGLLCPTMDVADWGRHQHELHARVAPVRAAEHHIPIFRVASSGISQFINANGQTLAAINFPEQHKTLFSTMLLRPSAGRPLDRWLAPACVVALPVAFLWMAVLPRKTVTGSPANYGTSPTR